MQIIVHKIAWNRNEAEWNEENKDDKKYSWMRVRRRKAEARVRARMREIDQEWME